MLAIEDGNLVIDDTKDVSTKDISTSDKQPKLQ